MNSAHLFPVAAAFLSANISLSAAQSQTSEPISLALPLACEIGKSCFVQNYVDSDPSSNSKDFQCGAQTYEGHSGTDFRLPSMDEQRAGVDILAAAPGTVAGLRDGMSDTATREPSENVARGYECGNGVLLAHENGWSTQYCHMAKGSVRVGPGQRVEAGTPLGRVGLSGHTEFPHLHFVVRQFRTIIDPFSFGATPGSCGSDGTSLWNGAARPALGYVRGQVINSGFAASEVTMAQIESGEAKLHPPNANSPALIAYARAIGLEAGDVLELAIVSPDGQPFAHNVQPPFDHSKAQFFTMVGRKRNDVPWSIGTYTAHLKVLRDSKNVVEKTFTFDLPPDVRP